MMRCSQFGTWLLTQRSMSKKRVKLSRRYCRGGAMEKERNEKEIDEVAQAFDTLSPITQASLLRVLRKAKEREEPQGLDSALDGWYDGVNRNDKMKAFKKEIKAK